jgi:hypothetical protein
VQRFGNLSKEFLEFNQQFPLTAHFLKDSRVLHAANSVSQKVQLLGPYAAFALVAELDNPGPITFISLFARSR